MKKILFIIMALVLCAGSVGAAFAYFTDVEVSTGNTMSAGTLDIKIADIDQGYSNNPVIASYVSPAGLAPGDTFTTDPVYIKNVGSIDIRYIWLRFCDLVETTGITTDMELAVNPANNINDISKFINLVSIYESNDGGSSWQQTDFDSGLADAFLNYWNGRGASFTLDGVISLYDLYVARNYGSGDHVTSIVVLNDTSVFGTNPLPVGAIGAFKFTFQLDTATTNAYQGDTATFEVDFIGSARDAYPDDELVESLLDATLGP